MLPVSAPSALTNSRSCSWFHSTSAPRRARGCPSTTLPCRARTSAAVYVRLTSFQRGLVDQSCWICSALFGVPTLDIALLLKVVDRGPEFPGLLRPSASLLIC